jgi:mannan endo-1,4-beta-mannosidase
MFGVFALLIAIMVSARGVDDFVRVSGTGFVLDGHPWYVCGANLWYGAYLGMATNGESRARLARELDRLQKMGINNLRVLGASEACAMSRTATPAIQQAPGRYNEEVLQGLDFLIQEAGKRRIKLVLFLNNFWDWSGGMPQYLAWAERKPAQGLADLPWPEYNRHLSTFYRNAAAQEWYRQYLAMIISRTNTLTGRKYCDDPTIMTWELANEPRPGMDHDDPAFLETFITWVEGAAAYVHSLDRNHLVTTGSEGVMGGLFTAQNFLRIHRSGWIDYAVFHLWPRNWGWFEGERYRETLEPTLRHARDYVVTHVAMGEVLGKPVVLEEFGLDRDDGYTPEIATTSRDRLYAEVLALIEQSIARGGAAAGSNFWLWGGEGRPPRLGAIAPYDHLGVGDIPQEPPGLNTVFDTDQSTLKILSDHYATLARLGREEILGRPARGSNAKDRVMPITPPPISR